MSDTPITSDGAEAIALPDVPDTTEAVKEYKKPKKVFTRSDIKKTVKVGVILPKIYPDYEPWEFDFRLKLSKDAEERRQEYLSLSPAEITSRSGEQTLDEVCDLLVSLPKGFDDLQDTGNGPGHSWRNYIETAPPDAKELLMTITEGANTLYWQAIAPREFRPQV